MISGKLVMPPKIFGIPKFVNGIPNLDSDSIPGMGTIGERVKKARKAKGVKQNALAKAAGMSVGALADLESGRSKSTTTLHRIAAELGMNVADLDPKRGRRSASDATPYSCDKNVAQAIVPIEKISQEPSRFLRPDPAMLRSGFIAVSVFFTSRGEEYQVDVDPDLLARAYEWAQSHDSAVLASIDADVASRLSDRGMKEDGERKGKRGKTPGKHKTA